MLDDFAATCTLICDAVGYWEIFPEADPVDQKTRYRRMMKVVHPDRVDEPQRTVANDVVRRLGAMYKEAQAAAKTTSYGSKLVAVTLSSRRMQHVLKQEHGTQGDIAKLFCASHQASGGSYVETLVKVARVPHDNDLLAAEAETLKQLRASSGDEFKLFYPELLDTFLIPDRRKRLRVNVQRFMEGFFNLEEVRKFRPTGLDPLDAAWVWRRMLWALGGAHELGVVHGALTPAHVIIHPAMHGVLLVDWCYSLQSDNGSYGALKAIVPSRRAWYPPDVFAKQPSSESADLVMAARTMVYLLGGDALSMTMPTAVPDGMQRYLLELVRSKDTLSAFDQLDRFDAVLQKLGTPYFPRKFRELVL